MFRQYSVWLYFVIVVVFATSCGHQKNTLVLDENVPDQIMKDATIQYTDSGRLQMITWGEEIWNFDDEDQTQEFPKSVKATFYDEHGNTTSIITADEGTNWQRKKLMNLRKNVVIVNLRDGKTLYTEDFYWDQDKAIIYSNVHVLQISEDGSRLSGDGFKANEDMTDWQVVRPRGAILLD